MAQPHVVLKFKSTRRPSLYSCLAHPGWTRIGLGVIGISNELHKANDYFLHHPVQIKTTSNRLWKWCWMQLQATPACQIQLSLVVVVKRHHPPALRLHRAAVLRRSGHHHIPPTWVWYLCGCFNDLGNMNRAFWSDYFVIFSPYLLSRRHELSGCHRAMEGTAD